VAGGDARRPGAGGGAGVLGAEEAVRAESGRDRAAAVVREEPRRGGKLTCDGMVCRSIETMHSPASNGVRIHAGEPILKSSP
jgi:hypothetical protein